MHRRCCPCSFSKFTSVNTGQLPYQFLHLWLEASDWKLWELAIWEQPQPMAAGRELVNKYAPWVRYQKYMPYIVSQRCPLSWSHYLQPHLLRNAPCFSFSSPCLVLLLKVTSNPCQYFSLPKLSVVLTTWKVFSKFHAPPPVSPSLSPIHPFSKHTLSSPLGSYCLHLCCTPFPLACVHFSGAFKTHSNTTSFRKPSMNFPTPVYYHPSLVCQCFYYPHQHRTLHHGGLTLSLPSPDKSNPNSVWTLPSFLANCAEPHFLWSYYHSLICYFRYYQVHRLYTAKIQRTLFTLYTMETQSSHIRFRLRSTRGNTYL